MTEHYLDNSATTQVLREAADKAVFLMRSRFGNPSSLHGMGIEAKFELDDARQTVASASEPAVRKSSLPPAEQRATTWPFSARPMQKSAWEIEL